MTVPSLQYLADNSMILFNQLKELIPLFYHNMVK